MAVEIHYVNVALVPIARNGSVIDKSSNTTTLNSIKNFVGSEHRVMPRITGDCSSPNSADHPTIPSYLKLEADDGFAVAYMDQYTLITQRIT